MVESRASEIHELDLGPEFFRQPQRTVAPLLAAGARAARVPRLDATMLLRHADVHAALLDRRFGAIGVRYYEEQGWTEGPFIDWARRTVVFLDPPDHDRLRALVNRAFSPRQVAKVRPITERIAEKLATDAAERGQVDFYEAFAQRLPLQVICEVLGIASVDCEEVGRWTAALNLVAGLLNPEQQRAADEALLAFDEYARRLIRERRLAPKDDLLSALIAAEEAGDRLSTDELVAMVVQLLFAGHETTRSLIGNGLYTLIENPEELARLRGNRSLMKGAVEEMLRYEPPIIFVSRVMLEDVSLGGVDFKADQMVILAIASANRDPEVFASPGRFDVGRSDNQHLSFGFGAHFCLGASIARMEGRVAFETLLDQFEAFEFVGGRPPRFAGGGALRTLESFPVRLHPAERPG